MLGVVIVNFQTPGLVVKCVNSLLEHGISAPEQIIVVDNCSGNHYFKYLLENLPQGVKLELAEVNVGFGSGVNIGLAQLDTELALVLNPDTYFLENSVSKVVDAMLADESIGLAGLDLVYPDGERQYSARRFYSILDILVRRTRLKNSPLFERRMRRHLMVYELEAGKPFDSDWVMGTGFIIRRSVFERLGGMDESYFLYMEDVDLCARVWALGARVVAFPGAVLVHDHQRASSAGALSWAGKQHLRSLRIFFSKHKVPVFNPPRSRVINRVPLGAI
ncbi:glycosyltransferase family 2 protein [Zoogloea sp. LCSB751]|uniref:glycosyltransferase family 2 protein n=1 Tax=Zoogloea sp. LCSB751 TaxID=1965277 RepID=UPI0009A47721|nr:glycosyltransferase family 2 protein [Zoogloea sp. LCSB751]